MIIGPILLLIIIIIIAAIVKTYHRYQTKKFYMGWHKVSDRKPEEGQMVHVYRKNSGIGNHLLYYDQDDGKWYDENFVENGGYDLPPTHWHEHQLPDPPK